jgi:helicase
VFVRPGKTIQGLPTTTLFPVLTEAPRYLAWLGAQGFLGTAHPWVAIVAADLSRRIRWRGTGPARGSGRLLWMCEQMATPLHADSTVPGMFAAATRRSVTNPDWTVVTKPTGCRLDDRGYVALLRDRATDVALVERGDLVSVTAPSDVAVLTWTGQAYHRARGQEFRYTDPASCHGTAAFTRRGDYRATGWLMAYCP